MRREFSWIEQNSIHTLLRDDASNLLFDTHGDGTIRYCSQENLRLDMSEEHGSDARLRSVLLRTQKDGQTGYVLNKYSKYLSLRRSVSRGRGDFYFRRGSDSSDSGIDQVLQASEKELLEMVRSDRALSSFALERLQTLWQNERGEDAAQLLEIANKAIGENELETADVILSGLFESYPDWSQLLNTMAHHSFVSNDYERALDLCNESLSMNPNHLITLNALVEYNQRSET